MVNKYSQKSLSLPSCKKNNILGSVFFHTQLCKSAIDKIYLAPLLHSVQPVTITCFLP